MSWYMRLEFIIYDALHDSVELTEMGSNSFMKQAIMFHGHGYSQILTQCKIFSGATWVILLFKIFCLT